MHISRNLLGGLLLATALCAPALADPPDVHARIHVGAGGHPHMGVGVHIDRLHRVPPGIRARGGFGRVTVRVSPFRAHLGWRVNRFTPRERALWTQGRWWHGRHSGRLGWWWWTNGGWFFYGAPVYPYPDYVSETYYQDSSDTDTSNYWYYCRDPEGYYPYVRRCNGSWEPVPGQPEGGYDNRGGNDQGGPDDSMGPNDQGPPDGSGPDDQGPPDSYGPNDQSPPDGYGPNDQGPPDESGPPDDQGPPDEGPPDDGPPDQGPPR
jgi:hypothetical protein